MRLSQSGVLLKEWTLKPGVVVLPGEPGVACEISCAYRDVPGVKANHVGCPFTLRKWLALCVDTGETTHVEISGAIARSEPRPGCGDANN